MNLQVTIKSQKKNLIIICIIIFIIWFIYVLLTGGGINTEIVYNNPRLPTVISSTVPSDLSLYFCYLPKKDTKIYIPFIYHKAIHVPNNIQLHFNMEPNGRYQTVELLRVSEVSESGKRDLTLQNNSLGFTFFYDGNYYDLESFVSTTNFIIEGVNHLEPSSWKVYEIVGVAHAKDGEQIEFQHTAKLELEKESYTILGWHYLADSYAPPSWPVFKR